VQYLIDTDQGSIRYRDEREEEVSLAFYSHEGFRLLSSLWLKQEWNLGHWQSFTWLGVPIWQLPEDLLRIQEVISTLRPEVILETGVKHGGSALFFASLCRLLGGGRVVSVDIHIPSQVRSALAASPCGDLVTLIEGDSVSPEVIAQVREAVGKADPVLVFLDSDHSLDHVLGELEAYAGLVTPGSFLVATDGVMQSLACTPAGRPEWRDDNPAAAARQFAAVHPEFVLERPRARIRDDCVLQELTFWPDAWLKRVA